LAAHRRKPLCARRTLRFGMGNRGAGAAIMIMIRRWENGV
jgi:hypothetical protein